MPKPSRSRSKATKAAKPESNQPPAEPANTAMFDPADSPPSGDAPIEPEGQGQGAGDEPVAEEAAAKGDAEADAQGASAPEELAAPPPGDQEDEEELTGGDVLPSDPPSEPPAPPTEPEDATDETSGTSKRVRMGPVEGRLYRVPIDVVQELLGRELQERVVTLRSSPAIQDLQGRMRATDGHCAPVVMTAEGDQAPVHFHGVDSVAAALNVGLTHVDVVTIDPGDAGAAQSWLAQKASQAANSKNSEDDLVQRVNSYYDD